MKVIMHDLDEQYNEDIMVKCDEHRRGSAVSTPCLSRAYHTPGKDYFQLQLSIYLPIAYQ